MKMAPKKPAYAHLRVPLKVVEVLGVIGVIISAVELSLVGVATGLIIVVIAAISQVIVDVAARLTQAQSVLDALPALTNIQRVLAEIR